jgi:putative ABC transport system permease protein
VFSVALGVMVFLAITIANRGAVGSFHEAFAMVSGRADLEIRGRIPETVFPLILGCSGVAAATPVVEAMVALPGFPGEALRVAGIDPFTAGDLLAGDPGTGGGDLAGWLEEDRIALPESFLKEHGIGPDGRLLLQGPGAAKTIRAVPLGSIQGVTPAMARVGLTDIALAQEWLGKPGELSAILIRLKKGTDATEAAGLLRGLVPPDVTVDRPAGRTRQVDRMLAAFRLNLTALSLVSLLVGMFFVGNSAAAAVVRKRVSLGILRAAGTSRRAVTLLVLAEAALVGMVGSLLGILCSPLLAGVLAAPVARTVTSLYLPVDARGGWPSPLEALAGFAAGLAAAIVASWIPARQAAHVDPARVLHPGAAPEVFPLPPFRLALAGLGLLGMAWGASAWALGGGPSLLGFLAAFLVLAGFSLQVPLAVRGAGAVLRRLPVTGPFALLRIALDQTLRSMHRTAPTMAALATAAAMTVGIGVMIHSFRGSVLAWTERTLAADLFLAPASNELLGLEHTVDEAKAAWWRSRPEVVNVGTFREFEAATPGGERVTLGVVSGSSRGSVDFLHGDGIAKSERIEREPVVALSESLARRLHLGPGDRLEVGGPGGTVSFPVIDLYRDYTRDRGIAMIGASTFRSVWNVPGFHSLAVSFRPGIPEAGRKQAVTEFCAQYGGRDTFLIHDNRTLKARILEIFNQTFAVTSVLRTIAILVAVGGVVLTLGILVLERARDFGILRATGASRSQILAVMLAEAALIGVVSGIVGLLSGTALALVLTWVINTAFFGWTIDLSFPWWEMAALPVWMTCSCMVAGILPAWKAASTPPAAALRTE